MKKMILVSYNGIGNSGGVERVCFYLNDILSQKYAVSLITKPRFSFGKLNVLLFPLIISFRLLLRKHAFVISNSWQLFSYPSDISVHHGTTQGCIHNIPNFDCFSARVIAMLEKWSAKRARRVLSVSENCTDELIHLYKIAPQKIITLNNFVDGTFFFPVEKPCRADELTIIFSGRICVRKGMDALMRLSAYIETVGGVRLIIACNDEQNAERFAGRAHTEIRTGLSFSDMNGFYNEGDVFYFPTLYEGFSMATLEALSCGVPVLGTKFAIPNELEKYDFCERTESLDERQVVERARALRQKFKDRRQEIHDSVNRDFGKAQYSQKLLEIISQNMEKK